MSAPSVLIVNQSAQYGGAEVYLLHIIRAFLGRGCRVSILSCNENIPPRLRRELSDTGVTTLVHTLSVWKPETPLFSARFSRLLDQDHYDLVIFNRTGGWGKYSDLIPTARMKGRFRLAAVEHYHPPAFPLRFTSPLRTIRNLLYCRFQAHCLDRIVCVNNAAKSVFTSAPYGYPAKRIHVIHNGLDTKTFRFDPYRRIHTREALKTGSRLLVLFCGRLSTEKGPDVLLRAWCHLSPSERDQMQLVFVGEGGMKAKLENDARESGLDGSVVFTGFQPDVLGYLCASDLFVLPSREESFGYSLAEAMAVGRYAIASRVGGVPEVMHDSEVGCLVEPDAPGELATAIRDAAADPERRQRVGANAQRHIQLNFSSERMKDRTMEVLLGPLDCTP